MRSITPTPLSHIVVAICYYLGPDIYAMTYESFVEGRFGYIDHSWVLIFNNLKKIAEWTIFAKILEN